MRSLLNRFIGAVAASLLAVTGVTGVASPAQAAAAACGTAGTPTLTFISDPIFAIDPATNYDANYIGYKINQATGSIVEDVWLKITPNAGSAIVLSTNQPSAQSSGNLTSGVDYFSYFQAKASPNTENLNTAQTHKVEVFQGNPALGGTVWCESSNSFTKIYDTISAAANKVTSVTVGNTAGLTLGGEVTVTASGKTGTLGQGPSYAPGIIDLNPAPKSTFPANAWRLVKTELSFTSGVTASFTNILSIRNQDVVGGGADRDYTAVYTFKAVGTTSTPTAMTPIQYIASGTQIKHTDDSAGATIQPLPVVQNKLTMTKSSASYSSLTNGSGAPVGGDLQYTVTVSNAASGNAVMDDVVDTIPTNTTYVANSAALAGTSVDATETGGKLVIKGPFTVPANGSLSFTYLIRFPATSGTYVNTAVAYVGSTTIDATESVADVRPASATVTMGPQPPFVADQSVYSAKNTATTLTFSIANSKITSGSSLTAASECLVDPANTSTCGTGPYTVSNVGTWSLTLVGSDYQVTFTPVATFTGTASIGLKVSNVTGSSNAGTASVTVLAPPTVTSDSDNVAPGSSVTLVPVATASAGTTINYSSARIWNGTSWVTSFTVTGVGTYSIDANDGEVVFTAAANATAGAQPSVSYDISDALGQSGQGNITVTITSPPPTIVGASATTTTTTPVSLSPTITGTGLTKCLIDPTTGNCAASATLVIAGEGTYVLNNDGSVTFTAVSGFTGATTVDYRITDGTYTRTAALNVTVNSAPAAPAPPVFVPPAGPNISLVSGTTIATTPITLDKPANSSAAGTACLVDPADYICKQSVTLPGKGTFTLNADGTTRFVAVTGFYGTATVQYRVVDIYGQFDEAPITVTVLKPAAPVVQPASGTTEATNPIILTPPTSYPAELGKPSLCLVDPADNVCKQQVTLPGKGTFTLNTNGTVSFVAATGFVGTATVQLRATDALGQSSEAPITVVVTKPAAPVVESAGGTTLMNEPIKLNPPVTWPPAYGAPSLCLVDPADNVCKSVVTLPGKGTFTLNPDGSVDFKPAKGFVGEATVQLRATDSYGQSNEAPITVRVTDLPSSQNGSTNGTSPVVLAPEKPLAAGSDVCLIDPNDKQCKSVVTIAEVGTWTQQSNGSVKFAPVAGYVGKTTVMQRITMASSLPRLSPYTVAVAKKRGPVTITISGFADGSPVLTAAIKAKINAFLKAYADYKNVTCIGYTEGPTVLKTDAALSKKRAVNACGFVKAGLGKKLVVKKISAGQDKVEADSYRRITITLND